MNDKLTAVIRELNKLSTEITNDNIQEELRERQKYPHRTTRIRSALKRKGHDITTKHKT